MGYEKTVAAALLILIVIVSTRHEAEPPDVPRSTETHKKVGTNSSSPLNCDDVSVALEESLSFFDDVRYNSWALLKQKVWDMGSNTNGDPGLSESFTGAFYQNHYEPNFVCTHARRLGGWGVEGKWVCDPHRIKKQKTCLVYSLGKSNDLNYDFSFEDGVKDDIGSHCEVHTFGYSTIALNEGAIDLRQVISHNWEISSRSGPSTKTLEETVELLGHESRTIDIFRVDCDGCELNDYKSWFDANVLLRQILVEVHHGNTVDRTRTKNFFSTVQKEDYVIFQKEPVFERWNLGMLDGVKDLEYGFLKLKKTFFEKTNGST